MHLFLEDAIGAGDGDLPRRLKRGKKIKVKSYLIASSLTVSGIEKGGQKRNRPGSPTLEKKERSVCVCFRPTTTGSHPPPPGVLTLTFAETFATCHVAPASVAGDASFRNRRTRTGSLIPADSPTPSVSRPRRHPCWKIRKIRT